MIGGVVAGVLFAIFGMLVAAATAGMEALFLPLRMIGAMILGERALDPGFSFIAAGAAGVLLHIVMASIFGAVFGEVASRPFLARSTTALVIAGSVYGLVLWLGNYYVIAPLAGWAWLPNQTDPLTQFVGHTLFFGAVLAIYLDRVIAAPLRRIGARSGIPDCVQGAVAGPEARAHVDVESSVLGSERHRE